MSTMTSSEAVDVLYNHLKDTSLITGSRKITGRLSKYQRRFNSDAEDVVINSLPFNREDLQEGVLNVNIHVPGIGTGDEAQPDTGRMRELTIMVSMLLNEVWQAGADYMFEVEQDNIMQDEDQSWFVNIRVKFRNVNF